jgi:transposase
MKSLSASTRQNVASQLETGRSFSEIAKRISVSKASVHRISKNLTSRIFHGRNGAPKKLSDQDRQQIIRLITSGKCDTAVEVAKELCSDGSKSICGKMVTNTLKMEGFKSAPKTKKPLLSKKHRQAR